MRKIILYFIVLFQFSLFGAEVIIDKPGTFLLGMDLDGSPTMTNDAVLVVTTSNLVIDLNQNSIFQASNNHVPYFHGIYIQPNLSDIVIRNGTITDCSGAGIYVSDGCSDIFVNDVTIKDCHQVGILFDGQLTGTGIESCSVKRSTVLSCTGVDGKPAVGVSLHNCKKMIIHELVVQNCDALTTSSGYGICIQYSQGCEFDNCKVANCGGNVVAAGYYAYQSNMILFHNCLSYSNVSYSPLSTARAFGFFIDQGIRTWVYKCKSVGNINYSVGGVGFCANDGERNIFEGCFSQINMGFSYATGFELVNETKSYITNCIARGNKAFGLGTGYGIYLIGNNDRCYIEDNTIVNTSGTTNFGIKDDLNPSDNLVIGNYAFNNGTNYSVTYTVGVVLPVINAGLSFGSAGLPTGVGGTLDNISIDP